MAHNELRQQQMRAREVAVHAPTLLMRGLVLPQPGTGKGSKAPGAANLAMQTMHTGPKACGSNRGGACTTG